MGSGNIFFVDAEKFAQGSTTNGKFDGVLDKVVYSEKGATVYYGTYDAASGKTNYTEKDKKYFPLTTNTDTGVVTFGMRLDVNRDQVSDPLAVVITENGSYLVAQSWQPLPLNAMPMDSEQTAFAVDVNKDNHPDIAFTARPPEGTFIGSIVKNLNYTYDYSSPVVVIEGVDK